MGYTARHRREVEVLERRQQSRVVEQYLLDSSVRVHSSTAAVLSPRAAVVDLFDWAFAVTRHLGLSCSNLADAALGHLAHIETEALEEEVDNLAKTSGECAPRPLATDLDIPLPWERELRSGPAAGALAWVLYHVGSDDRHAAERGGYTGGQSDAAPFQASSPGFGGQAVPGSCRPGKHSDAVHLPHGVWGQRAPRSHAECWRCSWHLICRHPF